MRKRQQFPARKSRRLPLRESAAFEPHDHDHADHADGHDDHRDGGVSALRVARDGTIQPLDGMRIVDRAAGGGGGGGAGTAAPGSADGAAMQEAVEAAEPTDDDG